MFTGLSISLRKVNIFIILACSRGTIVFFFFHWLGCREARRRWLTDCFGLPNNASELCQKCHLKNCAELGFWKSLLLLLLQGIAKQASLLWLTKFLKLNLEEEKRYHGFVVPERTPNSTQFYRYIILLNSACRTYTCYLYILPWRRLKFGEEVALAFSNFLGEKRIWDQKEESRLTTSPSFVFFRSMIMSNMSGERSSQRLLRHVYLNPVVLTEFSRLNS